MPTSEQLTPWTGKATHHVWLLVLLLVTTGCFHAGSPTRHPHVADQGEFVLSFRATPVGFTPGATDLESGESFQTPITMRGTVHVLVAFMTAHIMNTQVYLGRGVGHGVEAGLAIGPQALGLEARYRLLDTRRGDWSSLTASAAIMWKPDWNLRFAPHTPPVSDYLRPWIRAGLEFAGPDIRVTPVAGLFLSYGPEWHVMHLPSHLHPRCDGFGQPGCGGYSPARHVFGRRSELRLEGSLTAAISLQSVHHTPEGPITTTDGRLFLGAAPYLVLHATDLEYLSCQGCVGGLDPVTITQNQGALLVIGFQPHFQ